MKQMNWKELPFAGTILEGGNANNYKTGSWPFIRRHFEQIKDKTGWTG